MSNYKTILVAIDISADYRSVIEKALSICKSSKDLTLGYISLSAIYIQPLLYGAEYSHVDDAGRLDSARDQLAKIGAEFGIVAQQVLLRTGNAADEIKNIASDIEADLIVIGTHGRSGIKLLLGSTANAVLHGAKQDVLAVRIHEYK